MMLHNVWLSNPNDLAVLEHSFPLLVSLCVCVGGWMVLL